MVTTVTPSDVVAALDTVVDPEIPVLTIRDIGILRDAAVSGDGSVRVTVTPTYSGCPAMEVIEEDIVAALAAAGYEATVVTVFEPAWTTAWMSDDAKRKLAGSGIAPPGDLLAVVDEVVCPRCASSSPRLVSEFGSTACKRLLVCTTCGEPFDQFKAI